MKVKKQDIPDEANLMLLLWEMVKDFYIPDNTDEYWESFQERARQTNEKCNHCRLGQILINALAMYLEEKAEFKEECAEYEDYRRVVKGD